MKLSDEVALQRCEKLLEMAREEYASNEERSRRYVKLARKLAMRHRLPLGSRSFCKECDTVFIAGKTLKVRTSAGQKTVVYACRKCGAAKKFGYAKERKRSKAAKGTSTKN